jgi:hypothetical protein
MATIHRHLTESCTRNATITDDYTDRYSPSACVGSSQLLTKSPTDDGNSKGRVLMHLWSRAVADGITDGLRKIWRVIKKFWCEIQNLQTDFRNITNGIIQINII